MTLYVSNVAPETTREELHKAFQAHGEVESVTLPGDRMKGGVPSGPHRGYGFVMMRDRVEAQAALKAMDRASFHGRAISVRVANPKWTPTYAN
jgi:RNA recognition motif-containing protein